MRLDPREQWTFVVDSITKRLRSGAVSPGYVTDVEQRARNLIRAGVSKYEQPHGEEHPVRAWERGEVTAAAGWAAMSPVEPHQGPRPPGPDPIRVRARQERQQTQEQHGRNGPEVGDALHQSDYKA
jgi:hypothetical protein